VVAGMHFYMLMEEPNSDILKEIVLIPLLQYHYRLSRLIFHYVTNHYFYLSLAIMINSCYHYLQTHLLCIMVTLSPIVRRMIQKATQEIYHFIIYHHMVTKIFSIIYDAHLHVFRLKRKTTSKSNCIII